MAAFALQLALLTIFFSVKTETNGQIMTVPVELHTTVDLPCSCPLCSELTAAVQWYRSSSSEIFVKDGKALAWWYEGETGSSQGYGIKEDFSMIIYNLTYQHDQDLYRCIFVPVGAAECTHDVKLGIYANPDSFPMIKYIRDANGFNVTCSISNVYPMTFPILSTTEGKRTAYTNIDGTYSTTVTHWFLANENDTTIECLYSNLHFKSMSSLRIIGSDTIDQPEDEDTMEKKTTHKGYNGRPPGSWMVWLILVIELLFYIVIVYAIKRGNNTQYTDRDEHSEEEEPVKSRIIMLFGKLSWVVITLTIQVTIVLIILIAYLATARCLIEGDGKLDGNVSAV